MRTTIHNIPNLRLAFLIALGPLALNVQAEPPLPALNIDINQTSISGISSGGFMSVQFQVAHSSIVKGAGIVCRRTVLLFTERCQDCSLEMLLHGQTGRRLRGDRRER